MDIKNKFFQSTEELVSMFLGLIIVLIAGALIFNYFQKKSGNVELAGITDTPTATSIPLSSSPTAKVTKSAIAKATLIPTKVPTKVPSNTPTKTPTATLAPQKATETPTPAANKDNQNKGETKEYTVKRGDSLWKIAASEYGSGYNWVDIAKANNLKKPGSLEIGQKLSIPTNVTKKEVIKGTNKPKITIESNTYKVVKGDSLSKIALRAYGDRYAWTKIYSANKSIISKPNLIYSGMVLTIPR